MSVEQPQFGELDRTNPNWVPETRFGVWFQATSIWSQYVVAEALQALHECAVRHSLPANPTILDAGCGTGVAFTPLIALFSPARIIGVDIDAKLVDLANAAADQLSTPVEVCHDDLQTLSLTSNSCDLVLCHQSLHHVSYQVRVLQEFHRVLRPGGLLLISESCGSFTESPLVSALFRHPRGNQRSFDGYLDLLRACGFAVEDADLRRPDPWWSRPAMGLYQRLGIPHRTRAPTQLLAVGVRQPQS